MYVCMSVFIYVCVYAGNCMFVSVHVSIDVGQYVESMNVSMHVGRCVCQYVY